MGLTIIFEGIKLLTIKLVGDLIFGVGKKQYPITFELFDIG